jgi:hypothetical protein
MHRHLLRVAGLLAAIAAVSAGGAVAAAGDRHDRAAGFTAALSGYQEVPPISTPAHGTFDAWLDRDHDTLRWRLSYSGLEANATQAHIHFGQVGVNGGVVVTLCSNLPTAPRGAAPCPLRSGTVTGTARPSDVTGPTEQGIEPGSFGELAAAMAAGVTYANVHGERFPNGEIRGQIARDHHRDHGH